MPDAVQPYDLPEDTQDDLFSEFLESRPHNGLHHIAISHDTYTELLSVMTREAVCGFATGETLRECQRMWCELAGYGQPGSFNEWWRSNKYRYLRGRALPSKGA